MTHSIQLIFGKEQVNKMLSNTPLSEDEKIIHQKAFHFNSKEELMAFEQGLNEAIGWSEYYAIS
jgi:hypothetical protein